MFNLSFFANLISRKRGTQPAGAPNSPNLEALLNQLREISSKDTGDQRNDEISRMKTKLAEIILPDILADDRVDRNAAGQIITNADPKRSKRWATALSGMLGLVAGLVIEEGDTNDAIDEIIKHAKKVARDFSALGIERDGSKCSKSTDKATSTGSPAMQASLKTHIEALEAQAAAEADLEKKVALFDMAEKLRLEIGLKRDEPKADDPKAA